MGTSCCNGRSRPQAEVAKPGRKFSVPHRRNMHRNSTRSRPRSSIEHTREPMSAASPSHLRLTQVSEDLVPGKALKLMDFETESEGEIKNVTPSTSDISESHLPALDNLPKSAKSAIDSVLRQMHTKGDLYESEGVVGVDECQGLDPFHEGKVLLVVVTSHHLLWLGYLTWSLLHITNLTDVKVMLLSATKDVLGLTGGGAVLVRLNKNTELLKVIQESYHPLSGHYLPYVVYGHPTELQRSLMSFPSQKLAKLYSYEYLQLLSIIVKYGNLGETIDTIKESVAHTLGERVDCIFMLTDEAIYSLNRDFSFDVRVPLGEVNAVLVARRDEAVGVMTTSFRIYWKLPLNLSESLEKLLRARTGRNIKSKFSTTLELLP